VSYSGERAPACFCVAPPKLKPSVSVVFEEFRQVGTADKKAEGTGLDDPTPPAASGTRASGPIPCPSRLSVNAQLAHHMASLQETPTCTS
jgi:hypothetical protein